MSDKFTAEWIAEQRGMLAKASRFEANQQAIDNYPAALSEIERLRGEIQRREGQANALKDHKEMLEDFLFTHDFEICPNCGGWTFNMDHNTCEHCGYDKTAEE